MKNNWRQVLSSDSLSNKNEILKNLYNGIMNDYSIQHNTLGWTDVTNQIKKVIGPRIEQKAIFFDNNLLVDAIAVTEGYLRETLEAFARELSINLDTLRNKYEDKYR